MPRLWKHRPSPAMIVAMLALFVSMGGTGYAVSTLPKRSVGPAQLRTNAVRSQHIKPGSITTAKLARTTLSSLRSPVAAPAVAGGSNAAAAASGASPDRVSYADKAGIADRATLADRAALAGRATLADDAAAADTAAVADNAKLADNASKLGGKSVAEFLTSDTIRWITPFTIDEGTQEMLKVGPFTLTARCTLDATIGGIEGQDQADIIISTTQAKSAFDGDDLRGSFDKDSNIETRQFVNTTQGDHGIARFEASSDGLAMGGDGVVYIKGSYLFAGVNVAGQSDKCRFGGYLFL
jgi:hypothetical protein